MPWLSIRVFLQGCLAISVLYTKCVRQERNVRFPNCGETRGAFHLVKNSENSGSGLNGKRFFGSPGWKIPRKSGTAKKVVPEVPLFLGIFRSGEPKKRFPISPEPEFSEFLTKWKAPQVNGDSTRTKKLKLQYSSGYQSAIQAGTVHTM